MASRPPSQMIQKEKRYGGRYIRIAKGYLSYTERFTLFSLMSFMDSFLLIEHVFHLVFAALAVHVAEVAIPSCR